MSGDDDAAIGSLRLLVVAGSPDARSSTEALRRSVDAWRRAGATVSVWFLRDGAARPSWPGARVVDDLRTVRAVAGLRRLGLHPVADRVAGTLLRGWRRAARPQVVILDDGRGGRVLGRTDAAIVLRDLGVAPSVGLAEPRWDGPVAGWIGPDDGAEGQALPPGAPNRASMAQLLGIDPTPRCVAWFGDEEPTGLVDALRDRPPGPAGWLLVWSTRPQRLVTADAWCRSASTSSVALLARSTAGVAISSIAEVIVVPASAADRPGGAPWLGAGGAGTADPARVVTEAADGTGWAVAEGGRWWAVPTVEAALDEAPPILGAGTDPVLRAAGDAGATRLLATVAARRRSR